MIPRTWLIIAAGIALLGSNAITGCAVNRYVTAQWEAEREQAANDALREKARVEAEYRAREAAQVENTRNIEAEYALRLESNNVGRADFERRLTDRLRALQNRVNSCGVPRPAPDPGRPEDAAPGGEPALGGIDFGAVQRVRDAGLKMQETLRLCHEWATSVGR